MDKILTTDNIQDFIDDTKTRNKAYNTGNTPTYKISDTSLGGFKLNDKSNDMFLKSLDLDIIYTEGAQGDNPDEVGYTAPYFKITDNTDKVNNPQNESVSFELTSLKGSTNGYLLKNNMRLIDGTLYIRTDKTIGATIGDTGIPWGDGNDNS